MSSSTYNELAVNVYIELVTTSCTVKFRMVIGDWLVAGGWWPVAGGRWPDPKERISGYLLRVYT